MSAYQFNPDDQEPPDDQDPFGDNDPGVAEPDNSPVAGPDDPLFGGLVGGVNLTALADEQIGPAVAKALSKRVDDLAAQAVARALNSEMVDHLLSEADEAAQILVRGGRNSQAEKSGKASDEGQVEAEAPPLYYGSTNEFVREHLRHVYKRRINGQHTFWSPRWWTSVEALARLEALWRAWEHLRLDPTTGPSVWWRDHADPHMSILMSSIGPFSREVDVKASVLEPLPHEEPPEGLFPDIRNHE